MKKKIVSILDRVEGILLVTMFATMVLAIFLQVIMRYVFNNSLSWSEELGKFLFVWLSWIGISIGAKRGEHIKITMLVDKLPFIPGHIFNIISQLIVIGICSITVYYGVSLVMSQANVNYAGIKISMSWGYLAVVVGCSIMIIRCLVSIIDSITSINKGLKA
ncbi:TRAP transporter small permease [Clostridiisalibacter paucivorans]|uniref:TRAP transporter small permease n=1 Tax=Clostridiisalibacter paucivorans TaxID=408753 RepID=UPI000550BCCB|nr:TRAP transporter small permease [Clostridiisalibacter paucivorans]